LAGCNVESSDPAAVSAGSSIAGTTAGAWGLAYSYPSLDVADAPTKSNDYDAPIDLQGGGQQAADEVMGCDGSVS
jgi:hypothetical protein